MLSKKFFVLTIFAIFCLIQYLHAGSFVVDYPNKRFLLNGNPYRTLSGELHYFRVHPELWQDRLQRLRAAGLNIVQTYIAWNLHEPYPGVYDFSGGLNFTRFFEIAQSVGLNVFLRIGPFIDGEHENGALPWWLLKYPGIRLRTSDPNYLAAIQRSYTVFLKALEPSLIKNDGPVLMLQVENEMCGENNHNHICDHNYTYFLRDFTWSVVGKDVVLYTTDSANGGYNCLVCGHINETLTTVDFGLANNPQDIVGFFQLQNSFNNNSGPNVNSEIYPGWFNNWATSYWSVYQSRSKVISNLAEIYKLNGSFSVYMFHGGTNFGFQNEWDIITSYDYGAPIAENGDITELYLAIRSMIANFTDWQYPPQNVPANNSMANYGQVQLQRVGTNLISTLNQMLDACNSSSYPLTFEDINHGYGFVLYTTTLTKAGKTLSTPNIKDHGYVFLNNVFQGMIGRNGFHYSGQTSINLNNANAGDVLRIVVENGGRQAYWTINDYKGLFNVTLDGTTLQNWIQCGVNVSEVSINSVGGKFVEENAVDNSVVDNQPGVFVGRFNASALQDTFFDSSTLGKGQLFVNGFNLGRYWPSKGPQVTLYVPRPIIQPMNTVLIIELTGASQNYVNFVDHAIWSH